MEVFRSLDLSNWVMVMQNLQQIQEVLVGQQPIRHNRYDNKLYIDTSWETIGAGTFIVYSAYVAADPTVQTKVWSDPWLQLYTTAQIKQRWGNIMSKYDGLPIVIGTGGLTMNGQRMKEEAEAEIQRLEDRLITDYSQMPMDVIGHACAHGRRRDVGRTRMGHDSSQRRLHLT